MADYGRIVFSTADVSSSGIRLRFVNGVLRRGFLFLVSCNLFSPSPLPGFPAILLWPGRTGRGRTDMQTQRSPPKFRCGPHRSTITCPQRFSVPCKRKFRSQFVIRHRHLIQDHGCLFRRTNATPSSCFPASYVVFPPPLTCDVSKFQSVLRGGWIFKAQ